ncbi:hypothetical protein ACF3NT_07965 [Naumannella halotolerans]|uniref:Uncharacterized protein n=1 Tax=Naumannella halotolerans TaxID=993414 RepID=A0A4R7J9J6_9ACTN|nr:hypothetical protein [Naumannella halotolerans]TDT33974.1 hypothetical protein CLV29_1614 [Naumannella halotolerans]
MLIPLAGGHHVVNELFMPAYLFGIIGFVVLMVLLTIFRSIGKSRPHSEGGPTRHEAIEHH